MEKEIKVKKRTVRFAPEDYPSVIKVIKTLQLEGKIISCDLDRKGDTVGSYVHVKYKSDADESLLKQFDQFRQGVKADPMNRHLKVRLTPYTREGVVKLSEIYSQLVLTGDYAKAIAKHTYVDAEHLTIRFTDAKIEIDGELTLVKELFISEVRKKYVGDITIKS